MLEHEADAALAQGELIGIDVAEEDLPAIDLFEARNGPQQRRLARSRRTEQGYEFARFDLQRNAAQGRVAAEALGQVLHGHGNGHGETPVQWRCDAASSPA